MPLRQMGKPLQQERERRWELKSMRNTNTQTHAGARTRFQPRITLPHPKLLASCQDHHVLYYKYLNNVHQRPKTLMKLERTVCINIDRFVVALHGFVIVYCFE